LALGQDSHIDKLAADYAAAKAESERVWEQLQAELRAGTPASELSALEDRMWEAMHRLRRASEELSDGACTAWKGFPTATRRSG
jgi:hypothetical protein